MEMLTQTTAQQGLKQGEGIMKENVVAERASKKESKPKVRTRRRSKTIQIPPTAVKITLKDVKHFSFQGASFGVVKHDGRLWISAISLCSELSLDYAEQCEMMVRDNYTCQMFLTTIFKDETSEVLCLAVDQLNAWLSNLKPGWLKPEAGPTPIIYRHSLQKAVEDYFGAKPVPQPLPPPVGDNVETRLKTLQERLAAAIRRADQVGLEYLEQNAAAESQEDTGGDPLENGGERVADAVGGQRPQGKSNSTTALREPVPVDWGEIRGVPFDRTSFLVIRKFGHLWISIYGICEHIGLDFAEQSARIADTGFDIMDFITVSPLGGNCLVLRMLNVEYLSVWLYSIYPGRLDSAMLDRLFDCQARLEPDAEEFCGLAEPVSEYESANMRVDIIFGRLQREIPEMLDLLLQMGDAAAKVKTLYADIMESEKFLRDMQAAGMIMPASPEAGGPAEK